MKNTPAFPCTTYFIENGIEQVNDRFTGMTMRQFYKAMAIKDIVSAFMMGDGDRGYSESEAIIAAARLSAQLADAMLAEDAEHEVK